ncbi:MAG: hypothetical protein A3F26_03320 [Candidatus Ryanbacteria bacterium RIFCSPHIGHO2_12_FULL_47_12b]|uniref:Septum formation initiator n=2 Tax=Candidatus Ryaniibacteriota TaxID=1817914 RepID=A0A1G2H2A9_9BACT|nr:MAG: Septum formation initiator [Parcubacteria group bacterium GW2011_GWA2_47_10b]OGZ50187.1 MAG: hypothetical protein A3C83_01965 [Candidatus Ryanbacteria bacterium RIFCSPHIGHO2_02_FULL_47_25]OGZ51537.1 MAG: hypothetical protein A3F26_03320 [Candidatus Ryanbacteria bacterium RIFCSPHIGHO2_12_FULL_47_12b]OGZ56612.1 MAG: hypothetical protein A3G60_03070 [Candidatus Ryanbacteria bacterium RIFCSPLOWO2_12_FULL_47_9c]OGZ56700.1 MAG: hypothetical protein A3J04_03030 [Candidatus Ryanbacteria bacteri
MRRLSSGRKKMSMLDRPIVVFGIGLVVLVLVASAVSAFLRSRTIRKQKDATSEEVAEYEEKIRDLENRIQHLETKEGTELEARERLNLQKPGERIIIIEDDTGARDASQKDNQAIWTRIRRWFGFAK